MPVFKVAQTIRLKSVGTKRCGVLAMLSACPSLAGLRRMSYRNFFRLEAASLSKRQATKGKFRNLHSQTTAVRQPA
jgi:hypothetical protein